MVEEKKDNKTTASEEPKAEKDEKVKKELPEIKTGMTIRVYQKIKELNIKGEEKERIQYWISQGVKPSDTVYNMLVSEGIIEGGKRDVHKKSKKEAPAESAEEPAEKVKSEAAPEQPAEPAPKEEAPEVKPEEKPAAEAEEKKEEAPAEQKPEEAPKEEQR